MILNIKIQNFKALRDIDINLSAINVFTGLNGMGKSTILQALMLIRQSYSNSFNKLILEGGLVNIGTCQDAFCEFPSSSQEISFTLSWNTGNALTLKSQYSTSQKDETVFETGISSVAGYDVYSLFKEDAFMYLNAHRISPEDAYSTDKTKINKHQLGNSGELAPHYFHINKNEDIPLKGLAYSEDDEIFTLEQQVNNWLGVISPDILVETQQENDKIFLKYKYKTIDDTTSQYKAKNAGFGLTYVFSVLVTILSAKEGDIIIIENPESHIHPKGQSELARLMALAAKNGVQIFIETHSDHIIYGLRIAIKEKDINKEDARIYYLDRNRKEHFSEAHPIEIDDNGRMERKARKYFREFEHHLNRLMS